MRRMVGDGWVLLCCALVCCAALRCCVTVRSRRPSPAPPSARRCRIASCGMRSHSPRRRAWPAAQRGGSPAQPTAAAARPRTYSEGNNNSNSDGNRNREREQPKHSHTHGRLRRRNRDQKGGRHQRLATPTSAEGTGEMEGGATDAERSAEDGAKGGEGEGKDGRVGAGHQRSAQRRPLSRRTPRARCRKQSKWDKEGGGAEAVAGTAA